MYLLNQVQLVNAPDQDRFYNCTSESSDSSSQDFDDALESPKGINSNTSTNSLLSTISERSGRYNKRMAPSPPKAKPITAYKQVSGGKKKEHFKFLKMLPFFKNKTETSSLVDINEIKETMAKNQPDEIRIPLKRSLSNQELCYRIGS